MEAQDPHISPKTKRRRVQNDPDKKYRCPWEGCDKQYSRAEHLNRHKQNHDPKDIYVCEYCPRRFNHTGLVRDTKGKYDLDVAVSGHQKGVDERVSRHSLTRRESTDNTLKSPSSDYHSPAAIDSARSTSNIQAFDPTFMVDPRLATDHIQVSDQHPHAILEAPIAIRTSQQNSYFPPDDQSLRSEDPGYHGRQEDTRNSGYFGYQSLTHALIPQATIGNNTWMQSDPAVQHLAATDHSQYNVDGQMYVPAYGHLPYGQRFQTSQALSEYSHQLNTLQHFAEPYGNMAMAGHVDLTSPLTTDSSSSYTISGTLTTPNTPTVHQIRPIFSKQDLKYEDLISDDAADRFDFSNNYNSQSFPTGLCAVSKRQDVHVLLADSSTTQLTPALQSSIEEPPKNGRPRLYENDLTQTRFDQFVDYIYKYFDDKQREWVKEIRQALFKETTIGWRRFLSPGVLRGFLISFWTRVHPQMPILHQATFATDTCPDLLLAVILALGASTCSEYRDEDERTKASRFADFLVWHVRIIVIQEPDYDPPAKLWVLQTLILLEIYEKLFSNNLMHHNGISDHAQTVTRMRAGSSLVGRYCISNPEVKRERDSTVEGPGARGTINAAGYNTDDPEWNEWISLEAIKRIAFAAFILDTSHAHMFGHKPNMHIGDIGLFLPCSEKEWLAGSYSQVRVFKKAREKQGYKDITFTACLRGLLANKPVPVRTFSFGRAVILAGLLSFSSHAKAYSAGNEDIGVGKPHTVFDKVTRGLRNWEQDFEDWLDSSRPQGRRPHDIASTIEFGDDKLTESRTVLFHFAHMAFNGELHHCQTYISNTLPDDVDKARTELETWVRSVRASDATFHAVRCLSKLLLPSTDNINTRPDGAAIAAHYSAREDYLFHRPWGIYCAALTIWAYTYFRREQLSDHKGPKLSTREEQALHMYAFLRTLGQESNPSNMGTIGYSRFDCAGLLLLLSGKFSRTKWQLLREAGELLAVCAKLLDEPRNDITKLEGVGKMLGTSET
ncbi:hypothetical protein MBLNU457_3503t2 [Dothideomycetes sp. NU457]